MRTFVEAYADGDVNLHDIEDWVDEWHSGNNNVPLHEFLGLTWRQYEEWVRNPDDLVEIVGEALDDSMRDTGF